MAKKKSEVIVETDLKNETTTEDVLQKHYISRNFARTNVQPLWSSTYTSAAKEFTSDEMLKMLKSPYSTYKQLQMASDYLLNTNSNYNNVLDYFSAIMSFMYVLYPIGITENKTTIKNRYYNSLRIISKMNLKNIFPNMLKKALAYGESYWYDLSDNDNTIIDEIPREICSLSQIDDDNLWRYYVDLALITPSLVYELPEEIQNAYNKYIENNKPKGKKRISDIVTIPESYYEVSKRGFAIFGHMKKKAHDYPVFSHMFNDLLLLNSDKAYFNEYVKDSAVKTIHQKVPIDKDSGLPVMPKEVIEAYHNASKENVGRNISVMTNPFETEGIALDKNQQSAINVVEHDINVIQNDSGISETIFNANTTNGLGYSSKADAARMYPLLSFFTNYVNYKIKNYKCQVEFLHINIFEKADVHESYRADILSGGARSLWMATSDIDLYSYINLVEMEQVLDFDKMLVPKINASQQSGIENDNGRPKTKENDKTDSTVVTDNYK